MTSRPARLLLACLALFAASCINRDLRPLNPCITSGVAKTLSVSAVDRVDLLFVVDNSGSMREEQIALQQEFPRIIEGLVSGDPDNDPLTENYPPVASLRVAVVSTDLGVLGVGAHAGEPLVPTCPGSGAPNLAFRANYGDNGRFNWSPLGAASLMDASACDGSDPDMTPDTLATATLPSFLTFDPAGSLSENEFADRIACYAVLGTAGCGFEQQLESMLKSVTPQGSDIRFHAEEGSPESGGQGDRDNAGWLRPEALLAVLMVTDEDDCSSPDPRIFNFQTPAPYNDTPPTGQQANTRCARFGDEPVEGNPNDDSLPSLLHPTSRYSEGLVALKDGDPSKVVFALITGVPVESVNGSGPGGTNDGVQNLSEILDPVATPAMKITLVPGGTGNVANGGIVPSCTRCAFGLPAATCALGWNDLDGDMMQDPPCIDMGTPNSVCDPGEALNCTAGNGVNGICELSETEVPIQRAFPPRRLVAAARDMQDDGVSVIVQSICQDTFTDSVTAILIKISEALNGSCLPNRLNRAANDQVSCDVIEVLPTGRTCEEFAAQGRSLKLTDPTTGRQSCTVAQVAVGAADRAAGVDPPASLGAGWYYDDFTEDAVACGGRPQRISFTTGADPIVGSTLRLECAQTVLGDLDGPDVGEPCTQGGTQCEMTQEQIDTFVVRYNLAGTYSVPAGPLVCQSISNTCQVGCTTDADCPGGYVCFTSEQGNVGNAFCAEPTCQP